MIAAIQLRGSIGAHRSVVSALKHLNLGKKHSCVLLEDTPANVGAVAKCKDFVTYGKVSKETADSVKKLLRGKTAHLHPPRGGLKSIKRSFAQGGDLGKRDDMDKLVGRMLP